MRVVLRKALKSNQQIAFELDVEAHERASESTAGDDLRGIYSTLGDHCIGLFALGDGLYCYLNGVPCTELNEGEKAAGCPCSSHGS